MTTNSSSYPQQNEGQQFDLLFAQHPTPMLIFEHATLAILDVNQAAVDTYGYSRPEFMEMTIKAIRPPEDVPDLLKLVKSTQLDQQRSANARHRLKDGAIIDVELTAHAIEYNGQPASLVTMRDITARLQAERRLRQSEARYRQLVEMSPNGIAVHQEERIVFCNPAGARMLGADNPELLIGKSIREIVHPDHWAETLERGRRMMAGESDLYPAEDRYVKVDGTTIDVEVTAVEVTYNDKPAVQVVAHDITARKASERHVQEAVDRLRRSEARFTKAFHSSPVAISLSYYEDGRLMDANPSFFSLIGYTRDEAIGKTVIELGLITAQQRRSLTKTLEKKDGAIRDFEMVFQAKGGQLKWSLFSMERITLNDKLLNLSTLTDITKRKQAEAALQEKEALTRDILNSLPHQIAVLDDVGIITLVNKAWDQFARDNSDHQGHNIFVGTSYLNAVEQAIATDDDETAHAAMAGIQAVMSGAVPGFEFDYPCHSPTEQRWFNMRVMPLSSSGPGVVIAHEDITIRQQIEQKLWYQAYLLESVSDAVISTDLDRRIKTWNRAAEQIYGWQAAEVTGKPLLEAVFTQMVTGTKAEARAILMREGEWQGEVIQIDKDGAEHYMLSTVTLLHDADGNPSGIVAVNRDVTKQKRLEQENKLLAVQYHQSQKMESIGRLAGGIAHDFNNLLVPIIGYAELGLTDLQEEDPLYENFDRINNAANRAADLTRQILAFSRRQFLEITTLNLNDVVLNFQHMLGRIIGEDIVIRTHLATEVLLVQADKSQLEQVLLNLAVNARDAMPQGGQLTIETANVVLDQRYAATHAEVQPGPHAMLAITDTGHGMSSEIQQHIFEPFFTTKAQGHGTGLGLATVYGIVKQHRGNIWVYSEQNRGTTFKIYLPAVTQYFAPAKDKPVEIEKLNGTETVLVVEDEAAVRRLVCDTLIAHGYYILEADDPVEALAVSDAYESRIDLLLTDVIMPVMNGRILHERLTKERPSLRVIYMSGYTDNVIVHHGVIDEGIAFLQKPFAIRRLLEIVRSVLE